MNVRGYEVVDVWLGWHKRTIENKSLERFVSALRTYVYGMTRRTCTA
jgi:hypothetical protein